MAYNWNEFTWVFQLGATEKGAIMIERHALNLIHLANVLFQIHSGSIEHATNTLNVVEWACSLVPLEMFARLGTDIAKVLVNNRRARIFIDMGFEVIFSSPSRLQYSTR